jgi:aryl-alcohol dehydrogenase-like predicted oxidoreductase
MVSELCLGARVLAAMATGIVVGNLDYPASKKLVDMAIDAGVNFFDTADVYSPVNPKKFWVKH